MKVLTVYDLLVGFKGCGNNYDVELVYRWVLLYLSGNDELDRSHLGYCMVYKVIEINTGNNLTWGKLCVEDKDRQPSVATRIR